MSDTGVTGLIRAAALSLEISGANYYYSMVVLFLLLVVQAVSGQMIPSTGVSMCSSQQLCHEKLLVQVFATEATSGVLFIRTETSLITPGPKPAWRFHLGPLFFHR